MAHGEGHAEECERSIALMKDGAEPRTGSVAVHDEWPVEVRHLKDGASNAMVASSSQAKAPRRSMRVSGDAMRLNSRINFR